ncbi:hypothetical protein Fcan01_23601 [Folsomia candida]|uniref:Uncharacterized protein n=1 Tax=Folsomia candida TaxID=158441 RepID=A0A226D894_FOLCA|nr:hypothetical protein Fcan01_23601 [Folsomia candida]
MSQVRRKIISYFILLYGITVVPLSGALDTDNFLETVPFHKLLESIQNCHVIIGHGGGLSSKSLQSTYPIAIILLHLPPFTKFNSLISNPFQINVLKMRPLIRKLILIHYPKKEIGRHEILREEEKLSYWIFLLKTSHFYFLKEFGHFQGYGKHREYISFSLSFQHVYIVVLVKNYKKYYIESNRQNLVFDFMTPWNPENFAILFPIDGLRVQHLVQPTPPQLWGDERMFFQYERYRLPATVSPFKRSANVSIHNYLTQLVFRKANATISIRNVDTEFRLASVSDLEAPFLKPGSMNIVLTSFSGFEFLTCYSPKSLDFMFYFKPFEPSLWLTIGVALVLMGCVTSLFVKYYVRGKKITFSCWVYLAATCLEETSSVPSAVANKYYFRLTLGIWALVSTFLTNCYSGLMITDLNSPLPGAIFESFEDLQCSHHGEQKLPTPINRVWMEEYQGNHTQLQKTNFDILDWWFERVQQNRSHARENPLQSVDCFQFLSPIEIGDFGVHLSFLALLLTEYRRFRDELKTYFKTYVLSRESGILLQLFNPKHGIFPTGMKRHKNGYAFQNEGKSKVPVYFRSIYESGIYNRLLIEDAANRVSSRRRDDESVPNLSMAQTLNGSLATLFAVYGGLITLGVVAFAVESQQLLRHRFSNPLITYILEDSQEVKQLFQNIELENTINDQSRLVVEKGDLK